MQVKFDENELQALNGMTGLKASEVRKKKQTHIKVDRNGHFKRVIISAQANVDMDGTPCMVVPAQRRTDIFFETYLNRINKDQALNYTLRQEKGRLFPLVKYKFTCPKCKRAFKAHRPVTTCVCNAKLKGQLEGVEPCAFFDLTFRRVLTAEREVILPRYYKPKAAEGPGGAFDKEMSQCPESEFELQLFKKGWMRCLNFKDMRGAFLIMPGGTQAGVVTCSSLFQTPNNVKYIIGG